MKPPSRCGPRRFSDRLLDSVKREFPIGTFFVWKAGREHNHLFRHTPHLGIPKIKLDDDVTFVLDGQQRLTSLFVVLKGMTAFGRDFRKICLDLAENKFINREPDAVRYISVSDLWGARAMDVVISLPDQSFRAVAQNFWRTLETYPISLVVVKDKGLEDVRKIFLRINRSGQPLNRFDFISAATYSSELDLRQRFESTVAERLTGSGFRDVSPVVMTQLLALLNRVPVPNATSTA